MNEGSHIVPPDRPQSRSSSRVGTGGVYNNGLGYGGFGRGRLESRPLRPYSSRAEGILDECPTFVYNLYLLYSYASFRHALAAYVFYISHTCHLFREGVQVVRFVQRNIYWEFVAFIWICDDRWGGGCSYNLT